MLFLGICIGLYACDDGDLQIEEVDFDTSNIESCSGLEDTTETTFFFKIDGDEALLLNLAEGLIQNETSVAGTLASTLPTASSLTYRFFNGDVTSAYFCDALPPVEPTVIKENIATAGNITVDTRVDTVTVDTKNYGHLISINNLSLVNDQGEQLTDLSTLTYGTFTTKPLNSARLPVPFSNYQAVEAAACDAGPAVGALRLTKFLNDEFIALNIPDPNELFKNEITTGTEGLTLDLANKEVFEYIVVSTVASASLSCETTFADSIESWRFVSTSGTLKVETVASAPAANGSITYTHTITMVDLVLTSKAGGPNTKDTKLTAIPLVTFGTYTTVQPAAVG